MTFWTRLAGVFLGETANANPGTSVGPPDYNPGDPDGFEWDPPPPSQNRFSTLSPSPWSGWPAEWLTPSFNQKAGPLVDTAWTCLDKNSSILSTMPTFRRRKGEILDPLPWMQNPDPSIYTSWAECAKQLFWDYQLGEAYVLAMARDFDGRVVNFRVIPPWLVNAEMDGGRRVYNIGQVDVTDEILHVRYKSTTDSAHGMGPLEAAGARTLAAGLLIKLVHSIAEQGGPPPYFLSTELRLTREQAADQLAEYVDSRISNSGKPALLTAGVKPLTASQSVKDMTLLELGQWTESRIAVLLGVPPHLIGLPSGGDSMTYANVSQLFDFHDRSYLRTAAVHVMSALSGWVLPRGQSIELDSDDYTRPGLLERSQAYEKLAAIGAIGSEEVRLLERLYGDAPAPAATMEGGDGS